MKRIGVMGTMVWDSIYGRGRTDRRVEEWGGIAYALVALDAALPPAWEIVPLIKVGRDMAASANRVLSSLGRRAGAGRFVEVPQPNNRVTLRYESLSRRTERLSGGVPGWTWDELGPMVRDLDVLYVNFISGFEMTLDTAARLRQGFDGPVFADLHSLLLGVAPDGLRVPRPLPELPSWFSCFDVVQVNEEEMARLGPDPMEVAARAIAAGVRLFVVTLGEQGVVYFAPRPFSFTRSGAPSPGPVETSRIPAGVALEAGDPTGCGDVFGATLVAHLARGSELEAAIRAATAAAATNLSCQGAPALRDRLQGGIARG